MANEQGCRGYRMTRRRALLDIGRLGAGALTLPALLRAESAAAAEATGRTGSPKHCIFLFLSGGPAQQETFDPKPEAPIELRGDHGWIETNVPGFRINEHLPRLATMADRYAVIRSVRHTTSDHPAGCFWMMTGAKYARSNREAAYLSREDLPHFGGTAAALLPPDRSGVPGFVTIPAMIEPNVSVRSGQHAGFLGPRFDPLLLTNRASTAFINDPHAGEFDRGGMEPSGALTPSRLDRRQQLLREIDGGDGGDLRPEYARAFDLLTSDGIGKALDLDRESPGTRERYGPHLFGQSTLLARRLVEAGVRLVCVNWIRVDGGRGGMGWDTHSRHLSWARDQLNPPTDAAVASLLDDLTDRGLLDDTLVVVAGEFGRTPKFNKDGGRDHWPHVFSVMMAGAGIRGGTIVGASDRDGAYPDGASYSPGDMAATMYHCLGLSPHTEIRDLLDRPFPIASGEVIRELV